MATKVLPNRAAINRFSVSQSLNQSQYRKQISLANLLQRYGFPRAQFNNFLSKNHFLLNINLDRIEKSLNVLISFKIPQKSLALLISECPGVLDYDFLKKWEVGFREFGDLGVSPLVVKSVLEHSLRFQIGPDGFNNSSMVLKGLGFSEGTVKRVLVGFPGVMKMKDCEIHKKIEFLIGLGIVKDDVYWIIDSFPQVLGYGVENRLLPLVDEFESLGFTKELVSKQITREPRILGMEVGELTRCLELLKTLKCREPIKWEIFSNGTFRAGFDVKVRVDCLCKHGLIRREAFKVLWKEPRAIAYSIDDIEKKIEFLVNTMGFNVAWLVEVPEYLGVNFEKQIVPRHSVIKYLELKGGLGDEVGLKGMMKLSRIKFYNLYVKPYPECQKIYGRFSGDVPVERQRPVGLWKLFKPQWTLDSKEDAKNIKSFMEVFSTKER